MQYQAKFELGQFAVGISNVSVRRIVRCVTCAQTGKVAIGGEEFECPKCRGRSKFPQDAGRKWMLLGEDNEGHVARVTIEHYDGTRSCDTEPLRVTYILQHSMGGRIWDEGLLFIDRPSAQAECDRRNAGKNFEDEE